MSLLSALGAGATGVGSVMAPSPRNIFDPANVGLTGSGIDEMNAARQAFPEHQPAQALALYRNAFKPAASAAPTAAQSPLSGAPLTGILGARDALLRALNPGG